MFQPITTKVDEVNISNLKKLPLKKQLKKDGVPNYGIDTEEVEDMNLGDLFDETVPPQKEKQIVPQPPTYEDSLKHVLEGQKEIYVDPRYFPELPPYCDDKEEIDYVLDDEDNDNKTLDDLGLSNYDVEMRLNESELVTSTKIQRKQLSIV